MTKQARGQVAAQVRRRQRSAVGLALLLVLAGGAGWQRWDRGPALAAEPEAASSLDPELAHRFAEAQDAAAADGVELTLTSGWRSPGEQQVLVDDAVARYSSLEEAHRWVLPPDTSEHVQGRAIDVGPWAGAAWLDAHAHELGLCRTYSNEPWHFEKLAAGAQTCPDPHPDASWGW